MVVLNPYDGRYRCCGEHLESARVKRDLSKQVAGYIPLYMCPTCNKIWKHVHDRWVLLDKAKEDPFKV